MPYAIKLLLKRIVFSLIVFSGMTAAAQATPNHSLQIINNSGYDIVIVFDPITQWYCWESGSIVPGQVISNGQSYTVNWKDRNGKGDYWCGEQPKFIAFNVRLNGYGGQQYAGYVGMIHNDIGGKWYNALFWANGLHVYGGDGPTWDGDPTTTNGPPPPGWIVPGCPYPACAIGTFYEMYAADRDDYNWPLYHEVEYGWSFTINSPDNFSSGAGR